MAPSDRSSARFRSATEFPKKIEKLDPSDADKLYQEMRDCLIFTNRSRAQLLRRNAEHKESTGQLKEKVERLQTLINSLTLETQTKIQAKQSTISELERELSSMANHLDELSTAFDTVAEIETLQHAEWRLLNRPHRFGNLLKILKKVVLSWREDRPIEGKDVAQLPDSSPSPTILPSSVDSEEDRKERPQLYTDPTSINRSLLDK